jgi:hypothetical protein
VRIPSQNQGDPGKWLVHAAGYAAWGLIAKHYPLCTCVSWRPLLPLHSQTPVTVFPFFPVVIDPPRDTVFYLVQLRTAESRCSSPFLLNQLSLILPTQALELPRNWPANRPHFVRTVRLSRFTTPPDCHPLASVSTNFSIPALSFLFHHSEHRSPGDITQL